MTDGVRTAYEEGKGGVLMRAKMHIDDGSTAKRGKAKRGGGGGSSKPLVVITELPYQTNKVGGWVGISEARCQAIEAHSLVLLASHTPMLSPLILLPTPPGPLRHPHHTLTPPHPPVVTLWLVYPTFAFSPSQPQTHPPTTHTLPLPPTTKQ